MSDSNLPRPEVQAWQATQLRVTLFVAPSALPLNPQGWWESLTGISAESIEDKPRSFQHLEKGPFLGGFLALDIKANRISWELSAIINPEVLEGVPKIGPYLSTKDNFVAAVLKWLPSAPTCQRLAFGGALMLPIQSGKEGYRLLASYLPFVPDPEGTSDLLYQINRPRRSRVVPDLKINRLQTWHVAIVRVRGGVDGQRRQIFHEQPAIVLEPDINTDAEFGGQLSHEQLADLTRELAEFATELAAQGDRP